MRDVAVASGGTASHVVLQASTTNLTAEQISYHPVTGSIPTTVFASFQMMFAVITPLLITGELTSPGTPQSPLTETWPH